MTLFSFNSFPIETCESQGAWYSTGFDSSQLGPFDSEDEAIAASIESAKNAGAEEVNDEKVYPSNWEQESEF